MMPCCFLQFHNYSNLTAGNELELTFFLFFLAHSNLPNDLSLFYQCGSMTVIDSSSVSMAGRLINDLASAKTIFIDVDNAADELQVTDSFTSQLTPMTGDTITDPPSTSKANKSVTTALEESKSAAHRQIDITSGNTRSSLINSSKDTSDETNESGMTSTEVPQIIRRLVTFANTVDVNATSSRKPTPQYYQPTAFKHKKVLEGSETKTKVKYPAKKVTNFHSKMESSTDSSSPLMRIQVPHKASSNPHLFLAHRKDVNKIVVGQNELVFDSNNHKFSSELPSSNREITRESTTIGALWGMIEEVAYDTKRKSILKS